MTSCDSEGFPNVLVESILNHTLTVTTDVGDSKKIVNNNQLIVPTRKPRKIAAKLLKIINLNKREKNELLKKLKKNLTSFSIEKLLINI